MNNITSRIVKRLKLPKPTSYKGDNGQLLIIAGSKQYHGSLLYAIKAASKIVDLIYVLTTKENQRLVQLLKNRSAGFISVGDLSLIPSPRQGREVKADCVLIGPGMGTGERTYKLVERVLKSGVKAVLDADAINVLDKKLLNLLDTNHILTPHKGEFGRLWQKSSTSPSFPPHRLGRKAEELMHRYGSTIVLKGRVDVVAHAEQGLKFNYTGNEGMTKGGTGDVLAGLIAGLFCKNDAFAAAAASVYINGLAGDELYKKVGPYYNAEDLVEQIPQTLWRLINPKH